MNISEELRINGHQAIKGVKGTVTGDFFQALILKLGNRSIERNLYFLMSEAYTYGVIQGKRAERARRKMQHDKA